jgi:lysine-specific demethylase 3
MIQSPWHLPDAARPRLLRCNATSNTEEAKEPGAKPARGKAFHFRPDLQPVSRFSEDELREHWLSLTEFVLHSKDGVGERLKVLGLKDADEEIVESMQSWLARLEHPPPAAAPPLTNEQVSQLYTKRTHPTATPILDPSGLEAKNREFLFIENQDLTHEVFDQLWSRGEPIVVDKVGDGLKMRWTPDDFIERFGREKCGKLANA